MLFGEKMFEYYLEEGEKVIAVCHRNPIVYVGDLLRIILIGLGIPAFLYYVFPEVSLAWIIWGFAGVLKILYSLLVWYYDALLITDTSIIDIEWNGFFDRTSSRMEYQMVEGVTTELKGFLQVVFNFGNIKVTGSGGGSYISLNDAMNPRQIETMIMTHQEKYVSQKNLNDANNIKDLLATMIKKHIETQSANE